MGIWGRITDALTTPRVPAAFQSAPSGAWDMGNGVASGPSQANIDGWRSEATSASAASNWERTAWDAYRYVPEVRNSVDWLAKGASRIRLYAAWIPDDGSTPQPIEGTSENARLLRPIRELFGGPLQQAKMQREWYRHRIIAGKSIIAAVRLSPEERQRLRIRDEWLWMVRHARDITDDRIIGDLELSWKTYSGTVTRKIRSTGGQLHIPHDVVMMFDRVEDPDQPDRTISTVQSVMESVETLTNVADGINAVSLSRLSMSGIIAYTPDVTIPGSGSTGPDEDPVIAGMMEQVVRNADNRRQAAASAPHLWRSALSATEAPIDSQIMHIDTSTDYDERSLDIVDWASRRIAIGMSTPVEVTNGTADPNHWNALFEGQDGVRVVIGPDMAEFALMIDETWYDQRLHDLGVPDDLRKRVTVWWDGSALTQDPDRSATVLEARRIDPSIVTTTETRQAIGLPGVPQQSDPPAPTTPGGTGNGPSRTPPRATGLIPAVPSVNGQPTTRNPGFPAAPSRVNGRQRA